MFKKFDDIIKDCKIGHIETTEPKDAFQELIYKDYDIISFNGSLLLQPGYTTFWTRDYASDIKSDVLIYYVVDGSEYPITDKTRLFTFLCPFKPFVLRNTTNKSQKITFKQFIIKMELIDKYIKIPICEDNIFYYHGSFLLK